MAPHRSLLGGQGLCLSGIAACLPLSPVLAPSRIWNMEDASCIYTSLHTHMQMYTCVCTCLPTTHLRYGFPLNNISKVVCIHLIHIFNDGMHKNQMVITSFLKPLFTCICGEENGGRERE